MRVILIKALCASCLQDISPQMLCVMNCLQRRNISFDSPSWRRRGSSQTPTSRQAVTMPQGSISWTALILHRAGAGEPQTPKTPEVESPGSVTLVLKCCQMQGQEADATTLRQPREYAAKLQTQSSWTLQQRFQSQGGVYMLLGQLELLHML